MSTKFLDLDTFIGGQRKLNLSGFTEIAKSMTIEEFNRTYSGHPVFLKESLDKFKEAIGDELKKGGDNKDILEKAKSDISALKKLSLITSNGIVDVWVGPKEETIEKGRVGDALGYGSKQMLFKKSGKEIKERLLAISASIDSKIASIKGEMSDLVVSIGSVPTEDLSSWEKTTDSCDGIKKYPWPKCSYSDQKGSTYVSSTDTPQESKTASSEEEATNCNKYNRLVEQLCSCYKDKEICGTFSRNVEDKRDYELDMNQLSSLGF